MEAMNCKACRIEIEEAETNEPLSTHARAHVETCLPCRAFRAERESLRQLVGSLETVGAPPDFDFRLRARLNAAGREDSRRLTAWLGFAPGMSALALAASLALVVGAAVIFRQVNFNRQAATRSTETVAAVTANESRTERVDSSAPSIAPVASAVDGGATHHYDNATRNLLAANRRVRSADSLREPKLNVVSGTTASSGTDTGISSVDFDVHNPSPQLTPPGIYNPAVDPNPSIIVPVRALAQPAKFSFDEGRGAAGVFSLRNVTFGSEKLIEQGSPSLLIEHDASDIW